MVHPLKKKKDKCYPPRLINAFFSNQFLRGVVYCNYMVSDTAVVYWYKLFTTNVMKCCFFLVEKDLMSTPLTAGTVPQALDIHRMQTLSHKRNYSCIHVGKHLEGWIGEQQLSPFHGGFNQRSFFHYLFREHVVERLHQVWGWRREGCWWWSHMTDLSWRVRVESIKLIEIQFQIQLYISPIDCSRINV